MHIQTCFSCSKLIIMELVVMVVVKVHRLEKGIANLETVIWEEERGC